MARKRSYMAKRMSKMQGIPNEERRLLVRVGELVDSIINNRSAANPSDGPRRFRKDPRLPPPSTVTSAPGIRSVVLEWPAIDSSKLDHYRIEITNNDTGTTETKVSFTNKYAFKGRIGGNYSAKVSSVGRDGTQSPQFETDEFFISDNVMLLEGAKNGFNVIGTTVSEDFFVKQGHKVFAWASFVIDKSIAVGDVNNIATVTLLRTERDKPLGDASQVTIETINLYKASETATDLDNTALGGITRPLSPKLRGGTFGTEFNVMFSPFTIADSLSNLLYNFHLVVGGRDQEADIVNASLSLYSAHEGVGDEIPGDPQVAEPAITFPHLKSIWLDNSQASSFDLRNVGNPSSGKRCEYLGPGIVESPYRSFGDGSVFTIAYWAKDGHNSGDAADPEINWFKDNNAGSLPGSTNFRAGGTHILIGNAGRDNGWIAAPNRNEVRISMNWSLASGDPIRTYRIDLKDKDGNSGAWVGRDPTPVGDKGGRPGNDGPWGPNRISPIDTTAAGFLGTNGPGEWQFYTIFFDTVNGIDVYIDGVKRPPFSNSTDSGLVFDTTNRLEYLFGPEEAYRTISSGTTYVTWRGMMDPNNPPPIPASGSGIHPDDGTNLSWDYDPSNAADVVLYQAGVWDFSPAPMFGNAGMLAMHQYLWNSNDGSEIDWREDGGAINAAGLPAYFFSSALRHHWLFGNVNATQYMARDTGLTSTGTGTAATENGRADASLVNADDDEATNPGFDEPGGITSGVGRAEALVNGFSGFSTRDLRYICTASDNRTIVGDTANVASKSNIVDDYPSDDELWAYPKTGDR